ncbi:MAG: substrate-binding periplasmic protein [Bauldia sp.]
MTKSKKRSILAAATLSLAVAGTTGTAFGQTDPVRVAVFTADPFKGYCEELMTAITDRAGLRIAEFQQFVVADMVPAIADGTADVLCSALGPNAERRDAGLAFTSAILTSPTVVVVLSTNTAVYRTLADFAAAGAVIGGEAGGPLASVRDAGVETREYRTTDEIHAALVAGEITGWYRSGASFGYQQAVLGQWQDLKLADGFTPTNVGYGALAVINTNTALLGQMQAALEAVKADGTLAEIAGRWGMPLPPF